MSLLSIERRETPSLYNGERVYHVSIKGEESVSLLCREEADSSLYNIEIVSFLYVKEAGLFFAQRRECLPSLCEESRLFFMQHREGLFYM